MKLPMPNTKEIFVNFDPVVPFVFGNWEFISVLREPHQDRCGGQRQHAIRGAPRRAAAF